MSPQRLAMIQPLGLVGVWAPGLSPLLPQAVLMCVDRVLLQVGQLCLEGGPLPQRSQAYVVLGGQGGIRGQPPSFHMGILPSGVGAGPKPFLPIHHGYA